VPCLRAMRADEFRELAPQPRGSRSTMSLRTGEDAMEKKIQMKPIAAALGTTFAVTLAASPMANAAENPFATVEYASGYMVADAHGEGKCGEGKCGGEKASEGKCGEKAAEGKCGGEKAGEGKCGEKAAEGKCGGEKSGEGKCGGN
jgi:uncharacterized low-complexity protein